MFYLLAMWQIYEISSKKEVFIIFSITISRISNKNLIIMNYFSFPWIFSDI